MSNFPETAGNTLLRAALRGEEESWELLTRIYGPVVFRWAKKAGLSSECATDVVQDVFVTVYRSLDTKRVGRFRSWLWRVFRSRLIDKIRCDGNHVPASGGTTANLQVQELPDQLAELDESEARQSEREQVELQLRAVLALKDHFENGVWESFYRTTVKGDSAKEVADNLGITIWAVYKARNRCRQRLTEMLADLDFDLEPVRHAST